MLNSLTIKNNYVTVKLFQIYSRARNQTKPKNRFQCVSKPNRSERSEQRFVWHTEPLKLTCISIKYLHIETELHSIAVKRDMNDLSNLST